METVATKYAPIPGKIPGVVLNLGGHEFIAPPFNLDGVQEAQSRLADLSGVNTPADALRTAAAVILISLNRNYPDLTLEELLPLIDLGNWQSSLFAVCQGSGLKVGKPGESKPASP